MPRYLLAVLPVLCAAGVAVPAETYRESLIEAYPFYKTGTGEFAPVYPALAQQVVQDYGITEGVCVDVGGGCGMLAMALARATNLTVYVLDIDPAAVRLCNVLVDEAGLTGRIRAVEGDAQDMPFRDGFADLVISRGSIFFWPDQLSGLRECYRIVKPGAVAYVGGGFSRVLDPQIRTPLAERAAKHFGSGETRDWRPITQDLVQEARRSGIDGARLETEPIAGWWIEMRKPPAAPVAQAQP